MELELAELVSFRHKGKKEAKSNEVTRYKSKSRKPESEESSSQVPVSNRQRRRAGEKLRLLVTTLTLIPYQDKTLTLTPTNLQKTI